MLCFWIKLKAKRNRRIVAFAAQGKTTAAQKVNHNHAMKAMLICPLRDAFAVGFKFGLYLFVGIGFSSKGGL